MNNTQLVNLIKVGLFLYEKLKARKLFIEDVDKILSELNFSSEISFTSLMKNYKD